MNSKASHVLRFAAAFLAAGLLCSCESDDVKDKVDDAQITGAGAAAVAETVEAVGDYILGNNGGNTHA